MSRRSRLSSRRWAIIGTVASVAALAAVFLWISEAGNKRPAAPLCGVPQSAHTAPVDSDPVVQCFRQAAVHCVRKELDVLGLMNDTSVDHQFIVDPADHCRIEDYVTHYLNNIPNTSLDFRCNSLAELPDWGLVLTSCTPPVQCYQPLGSPVLDPPPVTSAPPVPSRPAPSASPAGPGAPAVPGQPHC